MRFTPIYSQYLYTVLSKDMHTFYQGYSLLFAALQKI